MTKNKVENDTFLRIKVIRGHFCKQNGAKTSHSRIINFRIYQDRQFRAKTHKFHLHVLLLKFQYVQAERDERYFYMLK
jgi:hypothetical protein